MGIELWRNSAEHFNGDWFRNIETVKNYDWIKPADVLVGYYGSFLPKK